MSLVKGIKDITAGTLDGVGDTLDVAGETLNMAADKIEGTEAPPPGSALEDSIRVNLVNHRDSTNGGFYMKLARSVRDGDNLSSLRKMIAGSTERKDVALLDFCSKSGIIVPDTYSIRDYIDECLKPDTDTSKDGVLDIYLRTSLKKTATDSKQQTGITEGQYMDPVKLARLRTEFDDRAFKLLTGTFYKYPAQLEEEDWSVVAENNALCYGDCVVRRQEGDKTLVVGLERARYPAFRLKKRNIMSDRLASKTVKDVTFYLRIPDFIIDDQSFVSIYETTSHLQSSLATSAFTSTDVAAAASGSLFGYSMSVSASYGESSSDSSTASQDSSTKRVTIAYNFPRVTVLMDKSSLELTMECQRDLAEVKDAESLTNFLKDYGEFFSSRVQLGGRLFATEEVEESSSSESKTSETKKAMKAAASASFGGFSASVSASHNENASAASSNAASNAASSLTWQARGGDTLLCNDPPAWCPTVGDFYYWRSTKKERVFHIVDFIGMLPGFESVPKNLAEWRKEAGKVVTPQRFSLQSEINSLTAYLEAYDPVDVSLRAACLTYQSSSRLGSLSDWEVETEDGENVDTIYYETPYRLRHPKKGYVAYDEVMTGFLYMTTVKSTKHFLLFRDFNGDKTPRPIPKAESADITMHFIDKGKTEVWEGVVFSSAKEEGLQYLSLYPPGSDAPEPTKLVLKFANS